MIITVGVLALRLGACITNEAGAALDERSRLVVECSARNDVVAPILQDTGEAVVVLGGDKGVAEMKTSP